MEDEEGDDDNDGPPPGFHFIIAAPLLQDTKANAREAVEEEVDANEDVEEGEDANEDVAEEEEQAHEAVEEEEEEEGPPPGFHSVAPKPSQALPCADMERSSEEEHSDDNDDDVDGPPPGWEFSIPVNALPKSPSHTTGWRLESDEDLDEGPPPVWETVLPNQMALPHIPPLQPSSTLTSCLEIESKLKITTEDNKVPPSLSEFAPTQRQSSPATPPLEQTPSTEMHRGSKEDGKNDGDRNQIEDQLKYPQQQLQRSLGPSITAGPSSSEKAQLVCGTCQKLCLYPVGTKWVQCPTCRELNFVLEAHEVGQVNCGGCPVLLMYPYGAPAVQCSFCCFVTQIGEHNKRPPLSTQLSQRRRGRCNRAC